jgi:hypothetical protein
MAQHPRICHLRTRRRQNLKSHILKFPCTPAGLRGATVCPLSICCNVLILICFLLCTPLKFLYESQLKYHTPEENGSGISVASVVIRLTNLQ